VVTALREVRVTIGGPNRGRRSPDVYGTLLRQDESSLTIAPWGTAEDVQVRIPVQRVASITDADEVRAVQWIQICKAQVERWPGPRANEYTSPSFLDERAKRVWRVRTR
jgi:hypothetical protein